MLIYRKDDIHLGVIVPRLRGCHWIGLAPGEPRNPYRGIIKGDTLFEGKDKRRSGVAADSATTQKSPLSKVWKQ